MASIFPNGNGSGEGKYLSLYIKLLPGEYDNVLEWPFALPISFSLYDQSSTLDRRLNIVESFVPDTSYKHFQKPSFEVDSLGFGYPKFVEQEVLKTRNYVRDDMLFIKVAVDAAKYIMPWER